MFLLQINESKLDLDWCNEYNIIVVAQNRGNFESKLRPQPLNTPPPEIPENITFLETSSTKSTINISILSVPNKLYSQAIQSVYILVSTKNINKVLEKFLQKRNDGKAI